MTLGSHNHLGMLLARAPITENFQPGPLLGVELSRSVIAGGGGGSSVPDPSRKSTGPFCCDAKHRSRSTLC